MDEPTGILIESIIAYRSWEPIFLNTGERIEPRLRSFNHTAWPVREPLEATCKVETDYQHGSPDPSCNCGVFGQKELDEVPRAGDGIIGRVALWGVTIEHEAGYRARFGYPEAFIMDTLCVCCRHEESAGRSRCAKCQTRRNSNSLTFSFQVAFNGQITPTPDSNDKLVPSMESLAEVYGIPIESGPVSEPKPRCGCFKEPQTNQNDLAVFPSFGQLISDSSSNIFTKTKEKDECKSESRSVFSKLFR